MLPVLSRELLEVTGGVSPVEDPGSLSASEPSTALTPMPVLNSLKPAALWSFKDDNQEVESTASSRSSPKDISNRTHYENIITAVRVRPMFAAERKAGCQQIVHMPRGSNQTCVVNPAALGSAPSSASLQQVLRASAGHTAADASMPSFCVNEFHFDHCFWSVDNSPDHEFASQQAIYDQIGTFALHNAFLGYNCSVFAYGQTSAGKTYTMMGEESKIPFFVAPSVSSSSPNSSDHQGLIPRIISGLFEKLETQAEDDAKSVSVELSYVEVYHERVYDLLDTTPIKESLKVREHPEDGVFVENATQRSVLGLKDIQTAIEEGNRKRCVAATSSNQRSSRSHAILTIQLKQVGGCFINKKSKLCLVDLAGSERVDMAAVGSASEKRLRETGSINKSLSTLADVICALSRRPTTTPGSGGPATTFIPYRNSVLTRLLKESLGGNAKTVMLAAISPCCVHYEETLSTLKYVDRAKSIVNNPKVNTETGNELQLVEDLRKEIQELKAKLELDNSSTPKMLAATPSSFSMAYIAIEDPGDAVRGDEWSEEEKLRMEREIAKLKAIVRKKDRQLTHAKKEKPVPSLASISSTASLAATLGSIPTPSPLSSPYLWSSLMPSAASTKPIGSVGSLPSPQTQKSSASKERIVMFALFTVLRHRKRYDQLRSLLKWKALLTEPSSGPEMVSVECYTTPRVVCDASVAALIEDPVISPPDVASVGCNTTVEVPTAKRDANVAALIEDPVIPSPDVASIECNTSADVCRVNVEAALLSQPRVMSIGCNTLHPTLCDVGVGVAIERDVVSAIEMVSVACNTTGTERYDASAQTLVVLPASLEQPSQLGKISSASDNSIAGREEDTELVDHQRLDRWPLVGSELTEDRMIMEQLTNQMEQLLSERNPAEEEEGEEEEIDAVDGREVRKQVHDDNSRREQEQVAASKETSITSILNRVASKPRMAPEYDKHELSSSKSEQPEEVSLQKQWKPLESLEQVVECMQLKQSCVGLLATFAQCVNQMYHYLTCKESVSASSFGKLLVGIESQLVVLEEDVKLLAMRQMERNGELGGLFECMRPIFDHFCDVFMVVSMDGAPSNQLFNSLEQEIQNVALGCLSRHGEDSTNVPIRREVTRLLTALLLLNERFANRSANVGVQDHHKRLRDDLELTIRRLEGQIEVLQTQNDVLRVSFEVQMVSKGTQTTGSEATLATLWEVPEEEEEEEGDEMSCSQQTEAEAETKVVIDQSLPKATNSSQVQVDEKLECWFREALCNQSVAEQTTQQGLEQEQNGGGDVAERQMSMHVIEQELMEMLQIGDLNDDRSESNGKKSASGDDEEHAAPYEAAQKTETQQETEELRTAPNQRDVENWNALESMKAEPGVEATSREPPIHPKKANLDGEPWVEARERIQAQDFIKDESEPMGELADKVFVDAFTEMDDEERANFVVWHQRALELDDLRTTITHLKESLRSKEELIWFLDSKMAYYEQQMALSKSTNAANSNQSHD